MADIFVSSPGSVVVVASPGIPMKLSMQRWGGFSSMNSILTGIQTQTKSGVQYMYSLRDMIYIYTFGERLAPMSISGLAFAQACVDANFVGPPTLQQSSHGIELALRYYGENRVAKLGAPVTITLGVQTTFYGFMDGGSFNVTDPDSMIGNFSFNFTAILSPQALADTPPSSNIPSGNT
jgi:hypothetical protein